MHAASRCKWLVGMVLLAGIVTNRSLGREPDTESVQAAIRQALPLIETASRGSAEARECFTCHSQAVPVFALAEARRRGFELDAENFQRQVKHTAAHLERGRENYAQGRGQGGGVLTAGYALWTLADGDYAPDAMTSAVTGYLLDYQADSEHWSHTGSRPPSSGSHFTATYVALRGLEDFAPTDQQEAKSRRIEKVRAWLLANPGADTEDRVFRLLSLPLVAADAAVISESADALRREQREDGGWAQTAGATSDAYATSTAMYALLETGQASADDSDLQRAARYLLDSQLADGSWHVATRAVPFQTYFETGFPHGKDQFISTAATGWATLVLLRMLPPDSAS